MEEHIEQATAAPGEKRDVPRCGADIVWNEYFHAPCSRPPGHDGNHEALIGAFKRQPGTSSVKDAE